MIRPIITLPPNLGMGAVDWDIDWREQSSGMSVAGRRNINLNSLPRWIGTPTIEMPQGTIGLFRAHRLAARGMTGIFRVTMIDRGVFDPDQLDAIPFSDDATFSDGTGFAYNPTVRCDAGAALGATEIVVNMSTATDTIVQGQIMSHDDFPFAVTSVIGDTLTIEMPLRRAIPAGELIHLRGRGLFEMVSSRTGTPSYGSGLISSTDFELQEWLR